MLPDPGNPPSPPALHVLSWDRPVPEQAAAHLARGWTRSGPLDLSSTLAIVPTRRAGRRLREALASLAATAGQAVFPPRVALPDALVAPDADAPGTASRADLELAWVDVLERLAPGDCPAVFPVEPPQRSFAWARTLAERLLALQATLAEAGLRLADVAAHPGAAGMPEIARWDQLGELERRVDARLASAGLIAPQARLIENARRPPPPAGITRIVLLVTPDPLPAALAALRHLAPSLPVEVVVCGPADDDPVPRFDSWGRPRPEFWSEVPLAWPDFRERVHLEADPDAQAEAVRARLAGLPDPGAVAAVGVADPEMLPVVERTLAHARIPAYNPAGCPWRREGLHALLSILAEFARDDSWAAAARLLRCPDLFPWFASVTGDASPARLLREADAFAAAHLPATLALALSLAPTSREAGPTLGRVLHALDGLRGQLRAGSFPDSLVAVLQSLFAGQTLETGSLPHRAARDWTAVCVEVGRALARSARPDRDPREACELALGLYGERLHFPEKPERAVELLGWLELLWEDAPQVLVVGCNDGAVPEAIVSDAFLPETLRGRLGLKTNAARFARDAYLLHALRAARVGAGRLDLILGRTSAAGDPLRPSRLLLRCSDTSLPERVAWLFRGVESPRASPAWRRAWSLRPRLVPPPASLSVTAFRAWLACPFRFYLQRVLRLESVDPAAEELDAPSFGTLAHAALQHLADADLRDCTDADRLRDGLLAHLDRAARATYGDIWTLPIELQIEAARQRLRKAADLQAELRAEGWRIEHVERPFSFELGGLLVRGTVDRIDRHVNDPRQILVLDYKTADTALTPTAAHLRPVRPGDEERDEWMRLPTSPVRKSPRMWADLQLPLYRRALAAEFGDAITCGYLNLPKAIGESRVERWDDLDGELQTAADRCADGVAAAVRAGRFWPPTENPAREDWAEFFHEGVAASIDPAWAERLRQASRLDASDRGEAPLGAGGDRAGTASPGHTVSRPPPSPSAHPLEPR